MIPRALEALKAHHQFIVYRLEPSKDRPGKLDKRPINHKTGSVASAHDRANWLSFEAAEEQAKHISRAHGGNYRVGFVLTAESKLFCLDIDGCIRPGGQLSPLAREICSLFPEAAIERSVSGTGIHIWGTYTGEMPRHACKNVAEGIELYINGRFIALGQPEGAIGNANTDCTISLQCVVALYFQPGPTQATEQAWTDGPCDEWRGPTDDGDLLRRAMQSKSASSAFSNKASFADLWNADDVALSRAYPAEGRPYDASSADAALAQHLAFWTGKDCERIRRLMLTSKLVRDKWDRKDYLFRTILGAVGRQTDVYVDEIKRRQHQVAENLRIGDGSDLLPEVGVLTEDEMLARYVNIIEGKQVIDLSAPHRIFALDEWKSAFKASRTVVEVEGNYNLGGTPKTKTYETTRLWEMNPKRLQVHTVTFRPGAQLHTQNPEGMPAVNTWRPIERSGAAGDASLFVAHVDYLFGTDAPRFLDWLAHIEQRPGELPHHGWVHISRLHGTGRNWLSGVLCRLWRGYVAASIDLPGMLQTGFNGSLSRKLLAVIDEIKEGGSDARWKNAETLKSAVTVEERRINRKYGHQRVEFNVCRWLIFSNHTSALPLGEEDRRFNVVHNESPPKPPEYYGALYVALKDPEFIAGVAGLLRTRDTSGFNPGAHAVMNGAKRELVAASRGEAEDTLMHVVAHWPVDVIPSSTVGELLAGDIGGKLTNAHRHVLERAGVRPYKAVIKFRERSTRVIVIRNRSQWENATPDIIRAELERVPPPPFGQARSYLDDLMAV
jgi:primase-polymerase (primpol)-like protein